MYIYIYIYIYISFGKSNPKVLQEHFHAHYCFDSHSGIDDWNFASFEQCETHEQ